LSRQEPKAIIPIAKPNLGEEEAAAAREAILSGWVTQGPRVAAFEQAFAKRVGAPYACATSSGTTALHLALLAAGVGAGHEVITASHSFIATANAIRYCGAEPVFVDIDPGTFNMDPDAAATAIGPRTKAILAVHQMGMPCDLARLVDIAHRHTIALIEDAACATGSEILWQGHWQPIGRPHGDVACFSFHPRKVVTTGDGGMLTVTRPDWDKFFRLGRQHGMSVPDVLRHSSPQVVFEEYPILGYNYRMTDLQAAVGQVQLAKLDSALERRRLLARRYHERLSDVPGVVPPMEPQWARSNWQSYCVRLPKSASQRAVMQALLDRGVATRRGIMCAHREPAYRNHRLRYPLPESERAQDECILLPLYSEMTDTDQDTVIDRLAEALRASER
jgi:dTDP-4-amino-4,6-dideoxygalactose transaminase